MENYAYARDNKDDAKQKRNISNPYILPKCNMHAFTNSKSNMDYKGTVPLGYELLRTRMSNSVI